MSTIFISHSSADNEIARELERRLARQHHSSVFLDLDPAKGITAGQSWERTLYRKLRACRAVIVLCTDRYLSSHWCFAELALARMEGKHIIALQVDPLSPDAQMPAILTEKQFIDLRAEPEVGYQRLWRGLKEMDLLGVENEWDPKQSPYLGLSAYQERHAPVFFGRDDETRAGLELLDRGAPGLVMVLGASGGGKSSLVRAGIVPALRRERERWLVVGPFRPRQDPFAELAQSLLEAYQRYAPDEARRAQPLERINALAHSEFAAAPVSTTKGSTEQEAPPGSDRNERLRHLLSELEELQRSPPEPTDPPLLEFLTWSIDDLRKICGAPSAALSGTDLSGALPPLAEIADHLRRVSGRTEARVLLVIDQFEELLVDEEANADATRFLQHVRASLDAEHSPLMALGTMRSDFLGLFQRQPALLGIDFESLSVGPMSIDAMRRVIEGPAKLGALELEKGLADSLLEDTETPDALPLLSFTLALLWKTRENGTLSVRHYRELEGLQGAVVREAEAVLDTARRQGIEDKVRRAFLNMARLTEDGGYARRPVRWDHETIREVEPILQEFEKRRLLVTRMEPGEVRTVEVAHEAKQNMEVAQQQQRKAQALRLAAEAKSLLEESPRKSLELARKGVRTPLASDRRVMRAFESLLESVASAGGTPLVGHEAPIQAVALSSDESLLATAGLDGVVALWDLTADDPDQSPFVLQQHSRGLLQAAFTHEGKRLAVGGIDGSCWLWDLSAGLEQATPVLLPRHNGPINSLQISPDDSWLVTGSSDTNVQLLDLRQSEPLANPVVLTEHAPYKVTATAFSSDSLHLATGDDHGTIFLWDLTARQGLDNPTPRQAGSSRVNDLVFSPDRESRWLVAASEDGVAYLWNRDQGGTPPAPLPLAGHTEALTSLEFSRDGGWIVTASRDHTARMWSLTGGDPSAAPVILSGGHSEAINDLAISPDGEWLITASDDKTLCAWDISSGRPRVKPLVLRGHSEALTAVALASRQMIIVTISDDSTARLWNIRDEQTGEYPAIFLHPGPASMVVDRGNNRIYAGGENHAVMRWNLSGSDRRRARWPGHEHEVNCLAVSRDGTRLATADTNGILLLWDLTVDPPNATPVDRGGHDGRVNDLEFSPDGRWLALAHDDRIVRYWDLSSGSPVSQPSSYIEDAGAIRDLAFSPDGTRLAICNLSKVRVVNFPREADDQESILLRGHVGPVECVAFGPDGTKVASGSRDKTARIWNLTSPDPSHAPLVLAGHTAPLTSLAFSPDGRRVVTGGADNTARVWELSPPVETFALRGHRETVTFVDILEDNHTVISGSIDGTVRVWELRQEVLLGRAEQLLDQERRFRQVTAARHQNAVLFESFEGDSYGDWMVTDDAFGSRPARGTILRGQQGAGFVCGFINDDRPTGTLSSRPFTIEHPWINFLAFGGYHPEETYIALLVDGEMVRTTCGTESGRFNDESFVWLTWRSWEVSEFIGRSAQVKVVDNHRGGWGHISVDHIVQSDERWERPGIPGAAQQVSAIYVAGRWLDQDGHSFVIEQTRGSLIVTSETTLGAEDGPQYEGRARQDSIEMTRDGTTWLGQLSPNSLKIIWDNGQGSWEKHEE